MPDAPTPVAFPTSITDPDSNRWWRRRRRLVVAGLTVSALIAGVAYSQASAASTPSYRTATAGDHDVTSVLTSVGTIEPVSQAAVAFPTSGTVATVDVHVGDSVNAGQTLATLDTASLVASLHDKQAALAEAELALSKALAGDSSGSTGTTGTTGSGNDARIPTSSTTTTTARSGSSTPSGNQQLAADQQAVLAAQKAVDAAVATANQALASSTQICASVSASDPSSLSACQAALSAVSDAQAAVSTAQTTLTTASSALDALLLQQSSSSTSTSSNDAASSNTSSTSPNSSSSSSPSSADLAADQKAVDAATDEVAVAEQAVAQATIASPIAGTVEAVNLQVGDDVSAASTTATVVVVGAGGFEVTTTVSVDEVPKVKVGQTATVVADTSGETLAGTVVSISVAPSSSSSSSTTTYRVVIGLAAPNTDLGNGSTGTVAIVTAGGSSVLAVPTSAVTTNGTRHTVRVLEGSTATETEVEVGAIGYEWTQITSGLSAGQTVVLADIDQALPGSATTATSSSNRQSTTGPPGGFEGGGPIRITRGGPGG